MGGFSMCTTVDQEQREHIQRNRVTEIINETDVAF